MDEGVQASTLCASRVIVRREVSVTRSGNPDRFDVYDLRPIGTWISIDMIDPSKMVEPRGRSYEKDGFVYHIKYKLKRKKYALLKIDIASGLESVIDCFDSKPEAHEYRALILSATLHNIEPLLQDQHNSGEAR